MPVFLGFPGGSVSKESVCDGEDLGSVPRLGRSFGEGKSYLLKYSGLENSMDRKELDTTEQLSLSKLISRWMWVVPLEVGKLSPFGWGSH